MQPSSSTIYCLHSAFYPLILSFSTVKLLVFIQIFFFTYFYFGCFAWMFVCVPCACLVSMKAGTGCWIPWIFLGIQPWSSERRVSALNFWAISLGPNFSTSCLLCTQWIQFTTNTVVLCIHELNILPWVIHWTHSTCWTSKHGFTSFQYHPITCIGVISSQIIYYSMSYNVYWYLF